MPSKGKSERGMAGKEQQEDQGPGKLAEVAPGKGEYRA